MAITVREFEQFFGQFKSNPAARNLDIDSYTDTVRAEFEQYSDALVNEGRPTEYVPQAYYKNALEYLIVSNFKRFFLDELAMTISIRENFTGSTIQAVIFEGRETPFPVSGGVTELKDAYDELSRLFRIIRRELLGLENNNIDILDPL